MPGARPYFDPATVESSVADDAHLQRRLQSEFEEDVARIFDESLYSDLELNCGKSKIRAHTCILKTRTKSFYKNLEKILHVNFGKNAYDEIYSFISDAYTECDIKKQEREIIEYLSEHTKDTVIPARKKNDSHHKGSDLNTKLFSLSAREISEKINAFSTPEYISPLQDITRSKVSSSPSTELIREYYALVPIDAHFLEKEIKEQEELSSAFQSIIKSQHQSSKKILRNKPTSLSLKSSHVAKNNTNNSLNAEASLNVNKLKNIASVDNKYSGVERSAHVLPCNLKQINTKCESQSKFAEEDKTSEHTISPDSLVSDDPSSSSDYVSAANNLSPGVITCAIPPHLNAREGSIAMDHAYTSSDSGLETSGFLESLNGQRDTTLTDTSLTESTLQDLTSDNYGSPSHRQQNDIRIHSSGPSFDSSESQHRTRDKGIREIPSRHSKEEKQRQNEEIVILESSSLSSETGSWESVFPLKINAEKDQCKAFLANERIASEIRKELPKNPINTVIESSSNVEHKSPHKSTCCFIDAASLVDDDETKIRIQNEIRSPPAQTLPIVNHYPPPPSQPLPCSTAKLDSSPNDWSEQNENDDSLEQVDNKDPDSLQKDISPTIFDMTPITEDSLSTNPFETNLKLAEENKKTEKEEITGLNETKPQANVLREHISTSTPYNSIMSLRSSSVKQLDSEEGDSDSTLVSNESSRTNIKRLRKFTDASPIVSGGASIEDHLPQLSINSISPIVRRKIDNIPIVSGAAPEEEREIIPERKINKSHLSSSFVIDMSYKSEPNIHRKPADRTCENLKNQSRFIPSDNGSRSRSSVDSDSSEVSSHKFYIDLSSLPDPDTTSSSQNANTSEKKNIFSMYIDIGDKTTVKEMPARLSSSLNARRNPDSDAEVSSSPKANRKKKILKNLNNTDSLNNSTFEKYEALCSNPDISISEIVGNHNDTSGQVAKNVITKIIKENVTSLPKESKCKSENESSSDVFVRLSDLDRPSPQPTDDFSSIPKSHIPEIRMTRSIPGAAWDDSHSGVSKSSEVISSFHSENAVSLNRLFPHLKNEISRSMPGSLSTRTRSPLRLGSSHNGEFEEPISDGSKMSSVQSSYCRSIAENSTTDDSQTSSLIGNCQSKLGQDLLRMFLEEIAPDVVVEVSGRRFKAHKCILSSRCQYFAGILSGGWVESSGNVIILPPFSYNVVHFALCHIYSGVSTIPDSISIVELATIADMLGLEGLKEAIMFNLKMKYCHHFHKPCAVCTAGVLECFPLSSVYGLDDLYRKCLKWITKYFHKVWPTKAFATLPKELLDKCYQQHIINMTTENIVDTVVACGMTEASLHSSRWAETVAGMCRRLLNAAAHFAATRLREVCRACAAAAAAPPPAAAAALDACLATAIDWAPPDETCRTYSFLANIVKEIRSHQNPKPDVISNVDVLTVKSNFLCSRAAEWRARCERSVVRSALRVIDSEAYQELSPELRKRLKDLGCTVYDTKAANVTTSVQERKTKYPITRATKSQISSSRNMDIDHVRQSFVPYVAKPIMPVRSSVTRSSEDTARSGKSTSQPPKIRTTKAQEERAKYNIAITNKSREGVNNKVVSRPNKFDNTKSRYMEPKAMKDVEVRKPAMNRMSVKMISSSESSRNSSPVEARGGRLGRAGGRRHAHSQDSLLAAASRPRTADLSTDSLSESHATNKYATYTKTKHTNQIHEPTTVQPQSRRYLPANIKTKIPVYKNSYRCPEVTNKQNNINGSNSTGKSSVSSVHKSSERRVPTSLTSATKSSSAKIVTRANHPSTSTGLANGNKQKTKPKTANNKPVETKPLKEIPTMDRSGTFLKDEPTFGDKAIDVADSKII